MSAPGDFYNVEWSADAFERLGQLADARDWIALKIEQAVVECRTNAKKTAGFEYDHLHDRIRERDSYAPIPWLKIAIALNISPSTATTRYAHLVDEAKT